MRNNVYRGNGRGDGSLEKSRRKNTVSTLKSRAFFSTLVLLNRLRDKFFFVKKIGLRDKFFFVKKIGAQK